MKFVGNYVLRVQENDSFVQILEYFFVSIVLFCQDKCFKLIFIQPFDVFDYDEFRFAAVVFVLQKLEYQVEEKYLFVSFVKVAILIQLPYL